MIAMSADKVVIKDPTKWTLNLLKDNCDTNGLNLEASLMFEKGIYC